MTDPQSVDGLIALAQAGDAAARGQLFALHREALRRMVRFRLDRRLWGRVDPSDVLQEAAVDVLVRLERYLDDPQLPLLVWLRLVTGERLVKIHRDQLGTQKRDAGREVPLRPAASSWAMAAEPAADQTTPSQAAARAEHAGRVAEALNALDPLDREVLSLRHFEGLTRAEAAAELGITDAAAKHRYARALRLFKRALDSTT